MSETSSATPPELPTPSNATTKKRKAVEPKPVLPRNSACLNCRMRKLKCDGVHPICTTCSKSLRYATEHLKAGVPPPPCVWEDSDGLAAGILPKSKAVKRVRKSAGGASEATGSSPGRSSAPESLQASRETSVQPQPASVSYSTAPPPPLTSIESQGSSSSADRLPPPSRLLPPGHSVDTFPSSYRPELSRYPHPPAPQGGSAAALEDAHTLASLPWLFGDASRAGPVETFPPRQTSTDQTPQPALQPSYHAQTVPSNGYPPQYMPADYASTTATTSTSSAPSTAPPSHSSTFNGHTYPTSDNSGGEVRKSSPNMPPPLGPNPRRDDPFCAPAWLAQAPPPANTSMPPPRAQSRASGSSKGYPIDVVFTELLDSSRAFSNATAHSPTYFPSPPAPAHQTSTSSASSKGKARDVDPPIGIEGVSFPFSEQDMTAIFWPGWPPHLPAPEKMHRIIETFFGCAHMANNVVNKSKLLRNLSLPPTHHAFPHPTLLHAICAISARFLGDVYMQPAAEAAFPEAPVRSHHRNLLRTPGSERPTWDGINGGRGPPATARVGIDGDFGEIHATWASLYAEESLNDATCWMAIIQASTLLSQYYIQHAMWSAGCLITARAVRMLTPLGLHMKDIPETISALFPDPPDGIAISERRNLFWTLFAIDTLSSAASEWAGMIDDRSVTQWMPSCEASGAKAEDDGSRDCSQSIHAYRIFHEHSTGITSMQLMYKSILILRRVHEFLRLTKTLEMPDAQESSEFRRLDALLSSFRQSLPAEHRSAVRYQASSSGGGQPTLDLDTLMCHVCSLSAVIQLHEPFAKVFKESDYSLLRLLAASRGIIGIVHQLSATSFDLSRLPPYASFTFFLAARCVSHVLRRATYRGDREIEAACRAEIGLLRAAMDEIGQRLPIGVRESVMCAAILKDIADDGDGFSQYSAGGLCEREFVRNLHALTPVSSSNGGSAEVQLSSLDQNMDRGIAFSHARKGSERGPTRPAPPPSPSHPSSSFAPLVGGGGGGEAPTGGEHRWAEQLAQEVGEEGQLLGTSLEALWTGTGDDILFQTLSF